MHAKDIKRIVREQLKKKHPNWRRLAKKQKKQFTREVTDAVVVEYTSYNQEFDVPAESLIGIEDQQVDSKIIPQQVNVLIYILHFFHRSGLLQDSVIHGIDSTEIACDSKMPLYVVEVGDKKVRIYNDIDCDCGVTRCQSFRGNIRKAV